MHSVAWWPVVIVSLGATVTDLISRRIPNWLVGPSLALGIAFSAWLHGWHGLGQSLEGAALGLVAFGILFCLGGMGAGDVKLLAAIGAWIGPGQLFIALVLIGLAGGAMALGWAAFGGFLSDLFEQAGKLVAGLAQGNTQTGSHRKMPYAPAIAIGALLSFFAHS